MVIRWGQFPDCQAADNRYQTTDNARGALKTSVTLTSDFRPLETPRRAIDCKARKVLA